MYARLLRRGAAGALAATLLLAAPAVAHPYFDPSEVPTESLAATTLELAHGCDVEDHDGDGGGGGDEAPTREVAIEVPDAVTHVTPAEADGWELEVEEADDGAEVIVYTAEEGTDEPAPAFDLEVVHQGVPGDEVHWRVMQACDDTVYRWVGTPDEPAEDPAVSVVLAEADPDAPPPDEVDEPDVDDDPEPANGEEAAGDGGSDEDVADDATDDVPDDEVPTDDAADDGGGVPSGILIAVLVVTLVIAGAVLWLKGRSADGTDDPGTDAG